MNLTPLMQRGVLYGFISGGGTTVVIVLLAIVLNFPPGPTALVLLLGAILALSLLLGASGSGTVSATNDVQANHDAELENNIITPAENGGISINPSVTVIAPSTKLEYVTYFLGLGITATVLVAALLN